ncbi:MAG: uridine kinase, partial [Bacteroidia bacterium]|nr:uridine kinase [Bacteroidia bacterium]
QRLATQLKPGALCLVSQDHYYKDLPEQLVDEHGVVNFDLPTSIDRERFHDHILRLKRGETVTLREYTFNNPKAEAATITLQPAPILVVEGLFIQYFPEIDHELDLSIFIEAQDHLKLSRRIRRDNEERGYDLNDVLYRYEYHVMPVYERLIKPLMHEADLVIPNNRHFQRAIDFISLALQGHLAGLAN